MASSRAEDNFVVCTRSTGERAWSIILCIAVGLWALILEYFGIFGRRAIVQVVPSAAVLRGVESYTGAVASISHFQFCRADGIYVAATGGCRASSVGGSYGEGDIETINERDVIRVSIVATIQSIFSKCCRRLPWTLAIEQTATVPSVAFALTGCVEGATGTPPEPASTCSCGNVNTPCFALSQRFPATYGNSCRPNRVWTLVLDSKCCTCNSLKIYIKY